VKELLTEVNIKWFIGVFLPVIVTASGWIYVYRLGQRNIKRDKRITTYISTFNFIKNPINDAIQEYSKLTMYLSSTISLIKNIEKYGLSVGNEKRLLLESYNNKEFHNLKNEAQGAFLKFLYSWEQYEIVLLPLVKQRHALQDEYNELILCAFNTYLEYSSYFYALNQGFEVTLDATEKLIITLQDYHDKTFDFFSCIRDVNINLQNFIFEDLFVQTVEKREVTDTKYLTIDSLITKHNS
jgi:hypothetical protein